MRSPQPQGKQRPQPPTRGEAASAAGSSPRPRRHVLSPSKTPPRLLPRQPPEIPAPIHLEPPDLAPPPHDRLLRQLLDARERPPDVVIHIPDINRVPTPQH